MSYTVKVPQEEQAQYTYENALTARRVVDVSGLIPKEYDYIALTYLDTDLTSVVYKTGGAGGTTVATLTLIYLSHVLQSVTRS